MQQFNKQEEIPKRSIDLKALLIFLFLVAIVGSAIYNFIKFLAYIFTGKKISNETDVIKYLESVLDNYEPDGIDDILLEKGERIKEVLRKKFWYLILGNIRYQGSFDQGTFLSEYSDLDVLVQFKKTSFSREEYMYYEVYNFLKNEFHDSNLKDVRLQKVSIGLIYDINGNEEVIDIVPALRTDFKKGGNKYRLYVNPKFSKNSVTGLEMNPHIQRDFGDYPYEKIRVVTLLKLLMKTQNLPLKSVLIIEFTKKAFQKLKMSNELNRSLIKTIEFIVKNIQTLKIKASDNPNNCLTDELHDSQKKRIKKALSTIVYDLKKDKNTWTKYFPKK